MADGGSSLSEVELKIRDALKSRLGIRAKVTKVHEHGNRVVVDVVSAHEFSWTAHELEKIGPELAVMIPGSLDVN